MQSKGTAMYKPTEETISGKAGKIFLRSWSSQKAPNAIVVLCHGFNSHGGMYLWTGKRLSENGFHTYALDLRGRGKSEGARFFVSSFEEYVEDVKSLIDVVKLRHPNVPVFLFGHSAGGVASCIYTLDHRQDLAGLICESFAFKLPAPDFALAAIGFLSRFLPNMKAVTLKNSNVSRDTDIVTAMNADPLIAGESQPASTAAALVRANARLARDFASIRLPLLVMHGTADRATLSRGSEQFYAEAGSPDKILKIYKDRYHDLLSDFGKEEVIADIIAWLNGRSSPSKNLAETDGANGVASERGK